MSERRQAAVILPGLWLPYWAMFLLRRRLRAVGYDARVFRYHTTRDTLEQIATKFNAFLKEIDADVIHMTSQSMGGLVIRALFHYFPEQKPGRIVTFVPPHQGSFAARFFARFVVTRKMLGKNVEQLMHGLPTEWQLPKREFGVIAGNKPLGFGLLIPGLPKPSDGVVSVSETHLDGVTEHVIVPVSHTLSVASKEVARSIMVFLETGRFPRTYSDT